VVRPVNESTAPKRSPAAGQGIAEFYGWTRPATDVDRAKAALREEFPAWSIIYTDRGRWWAIKRPVINPVTRRLVIGRGRTEFEADTPELLRERLRGVEAARS
jgi:hypothetical protein